MEVGLSSAAAIAAATRRLISSMPSAAYSALRPPWTKIVPSIFTTAGLCVAHLPSSPVCCHASLCSTQPSGVAAIHCWRIASTGILGSLAPILRFDRRLVELEHAVAAGDGLAVDERRILARARVAIVSEQVHRLMIAEHDHHTTALLRRFVLELLEVADRSSGIGAAIGDIAELDEGCFPTHPMTARSLCRLPERWSSTPENRRGGRRRR